jgi:hypothetical protein
LAKPLSNADSNPFLYDTWLNNNTPTDALVLEAGCMTTSDSTAYRWLERSRYIMPECGITMDLFNRDRDLDQPVEWRHLKASAKGEENILELYQTSTYWLKGKVPVYLISWGNDPRWIDLGEEEYEDDLVSIYRLP